MLETKNRVKLIVEAEGLDEKNKHASEIIVYQNVDIEKERVPYIDKNI